MDFRAEEEGNTMITFAMPLQPTTRISTLGLKGWCAWCLGIAFVGLLWLPPTTYAAEYEVWVSDQANTQGITAAIPTGTHGGHVLIYDRADLAQTPRWIILWC
jgi:hypothetical protein